MMKKKLSLLLAALILCSLAAACNGNEAPSAVSSTPAPVSQSTGASASEAPPPEPVVLDQAFLTGLQKDADYPEGRRITAVMVNNIASSRPARGLSEAKILVESQVEGGITRFMAIYEDYEKMSMTGPIRSARDQFFQLILPYWAFYIHDGHSVVMANYFKDWEYDDFNLDTGRYGANTQDPDDLDSLAWRDAERIEAGYPREYTEYTDGEHVQATVDNNKLDDYRSYGSPIFNFVPYTDPARVPGDGEAEAVAVIHSPGYRSLFEYDTKSGLYEMSQFNSSNGEVEPTVDENNNKQLAFDNLVVLFAPMSIYPGTEDAGGLKKFDFIGGAGYYFSQGHYELLFWQKGGPNEPVLLYTQDKSGEMVQVNVGTTYLALVSDEYLPDFDATLKSGTAGQAAASGEVNPNEVDPEA